MVDAGAVVCAGAIAVHSKALPRHRTTRELSTDFTSFFDADFAQEGGLYFDEPASLRRHLAANKQASVASKDSAIPPFRGNQRQSYALEILVSVWSSRDCGSIHRHPSVRSRGRHKDHDSAAKHYHTRSTAKS
jgi:hypothetical protein